MSSSADKPVSLAENVFQSLIWEPLVEAALAALKTEIPAFAVWPLSNITDPAVNALSNYVFSQMRLVIDLTAIKLINDQHMNAYNSASYKLAVIAHDKGVESEDFKKAREAAKTDLSRFVKFNQ